jgi:hypothetical protein
MTTALDRTRSVKRNLMYLSLVHEEQSWPDT